MRARPDFREVYARLECIGQNADILPATGARMHSKELDGATEINSLEALVQELQLAKVEVEKRDSEIENLKATIEKLNSTTKNARRGTVRRLTSFLGWDRGEQSVS